MKIEIKEILRRIWLISANKIKPSESICKQSSQTQTQVIIVTNNCHTSLPVNARKCPLLESTRIALCRKSPSCSAIRIIQMSRTPVLRDHSYITLALVGGEGGGSENANFCLFLVLKTC
jgi:hypothetical protein